MSPFGVVLDACVLIPAALRDTLLRAAEAELYRPYWSEAILEEVERNLVEHGMTSEHGARRLMDELRTYFPEATVQAHEHLIDSMPNDPKDRHVLAVAVVSGAQAIITANLRDFPATALEPFDIEPRSPDAFLTDLFDLAPAVLTQIVIDQAAACKAPPVTPERILANLAVQAPRFAEQVRRRLTR